MISNVIAFPTQRVKDRPEAKSISDFLPNNGIKLVEMGEGAQLIPHKLYEFIFKATDSKCEALVLACLVRFTFGFQRAHCRASHSYIIVWTGLSCSSVRRGLKSLIDKALIKIISEPTAQQDSAVYEVPVVAWMLIELKKKKVAETFSKQKTEKPSPNNPKNSGQNEKNSSQTDRSLDQNEQSSPTNLDTKKENSKKEEIKNSLSQIQNYLSKIKSPEKHRSESYHFETLKQKFTLEEIAAALTYVLEKGTPSGKLCHSPFAFLSKAMEDVLAILVESQSNQTRREEQKQLQEQEAHKKEKERQEEENETRRIRDLFFAEFPTEADRDFQYQEFQKDFPFYSAGSRPLKLAAIGHWYSKKTQQNSNN